MLETQTPRETELAAQKLLAEAELEKAVFRQLAEGNF